MSQKTIWLTVAVLAAFCLGVVLYVVTQNKTATEEPYVVVPAEEATTTPALPVDGTPRTIGYSVEGRAIEVYTFGTGPTELLFVGGIHGGYEWNSVALAYKVIEYLKATPESVPSSVHVSIIPNLNPDGVFAVVGRTGPFTELDVLTKETNGMGRLNANGVDLNRNFDCKWQPEAVWRGTPVGAGTAPFSEPEALTLKNYVLETQPQAVIFWHSQSNAVYASECEGGILPGTMALMNTYAQAAGYTPVDSFTAYTVTGDAEGWLASIGIPAITVELSTHLSIEWEKNIAGMKAVLDSYNGGNKGGLSY